MSNSQPMTIDLGDISLIEVPYTIGGNQFVLKEASGDATCYYRNAVFKATELGPDGKPSKIGNMADVEPLLVSLCLYNAEGRRISVNNIRKWPSRVIKTLFEKVKEVSELDEEPEDRKQLEEAMGLTGSPCEFFTLQKFVKSLPEKDYAEIKTWLGESVEETAKNEQSDMEDGLS